MATFIMLPDGIDTSVFNQWLNYGGAAADHTLVDDDTATNSYIFETLKFHETTFTLANPSVAEADIDFTEDVTVTPKVKAHYTESGATCGMQIQTTGSGIANPTSNLTIIDDSSFPLYSGASTTTKSFVTDWDYQGLEDAQIRIRCTGRPVRNEFLRVSYLYIEVDYTEAEVATVTHNAPFFGTNF